MGRKLEDIIADQPQNLVDSAKEIASKQLIHIHLIQLLEHIGTDAGCHIDNCTIDSLQRLKQLVESGGGKLRLHVDLPDGSHHGFKL
ncbi:hypothetical protein TI10_08890 [Photorhabdus luminescens subsp. luminescens]|uniref:Uncharacterized protein n=1 Tax=Photorhabdus luminescens TaxID=29488 RepID=A0A1G5R6V4_PHOLU|nr:MULTISPECIES: hypothetical protein [Photorhabdus]KMW73212.1 hypothetical protein TI10_08890 [Photorhabdus luminescens subsp. luminescens]RAW99246.1 hypothetical protein CKY05_10295 [Photorhabdus sp. S10-54]RAW99328.1 hypothetical protein CKY03_09820 [Photorhabdus sp. S9-53]RAX03533.1 hypothetical protein CKY04_10380 [Photorhabdus sp. S8-52]SCZ69757.1 hypothetical protein SAMN02982990_03325 [Photorhabdus luminescens]